jgi:hypothetical protein
MNENSMSCRSVPAEFDFDTENEVDTSATSVIHKRTQGSNFIT